MPVAVQPARAPGGRCASAADCTMNNSLCCNEAAACTAEMRVSGQTVFFSPQTGNQFENKGFNSYFVVVALL